MHALALIDGWPTDTAAAAFVRRGSVTAETHGPADHVFRLASLTKPMTAWAVMVAVEEGSIDLDAPLPNIERAVADGATMRHLLAHAGGYTFDSVDPVSAIESNRMYSNSGYEVAALALEAATAMTFGDYLAAAVFEPLGMTSTELRETAAEGVWSTVVDMAAFVGEMLQPRLLAAETHAMVTSIQYPDLGGIVPGVGRFEPCPWGLGVEIHGDKTPHWMATTNSPRAFGHFGGSGTMMWAEPDAGVGVVALTDRPFGPWALETWPRFSDRVLAEAGVSGA